MRVDYGPTAVRFAIDTRNISCLGADRALSFRLRNVSAMGTRLFADNPSTVAEVLTTGSITPPSSVATTADVRERVGGIAGIQVDPVPHRVPFGTVVHVVASVYRGTAVGSGESATIADWFPPAVSIPSYLFTDPVTAVKTDVFGKARFGVTMTRTGSLQVSSWNDTTAPVEATMSSGRIGPIEVVATPARIARLRVVGSRGHRGRYDVSLSVTAAAGLTVRVKLGSVVIGTRLSVGRPLAFAARRIAVRPGGA
jgi:hypothetical protein